MVLVGYTAHAEASGAKAMRPVAAGMVGAVSGAPRGADLAEAGSNNPCWNNPRWNNDDSVPEEPGLRRGTSKLPVSGAFPALPEKWKRPGSLFCKTESRARTNRSTANCSIGGNAVNCSIGGNAVA
jgi:hypothetical protein